MSDQVFFSICIPAYKRVEFLDRLLESISIQSFRDFEVIVTDDSPDDSVKILIDRYKNRFNIFYQRNPSPLGSPENWNESVRHAKGQWIKLMHDDDWFADDASLEQFANAIRQNPSSGFIFCDYDSIDLRTGKKNNTHSFRKWRYREARKNPVTLFSQNIIGPPSVVVLKSGENVYFDRNLKWLVDIDFYVRMMPSHAPVYISRPLVKIGTSDLQVTQKSFGEKTVEIPESFYFMQKLGFKHLRNILVYDAWWRLLRNLGVRQESEIVAAGYKGEVPRQIGSMISWQKKIPTVFLRIGFTSKFLMVIHFLKWRSSLTK